MARCVEGPDEIVAGRSGEGADPGLPRQTGQDLLND